MLIIAALLFSQAVAQNKNGLKVDSINVVNQYKPKLADPTKMLFKPGLPEIEKEKPIFTYEKVDRRLTPSYTPHFNAPNSFKGEARPKQSPLLIKAGFGSNISPMFHLSYGMQKKGSWGGVQLNHLSANAPIKYDSVHLKNTKFMENEARVFGGTQNKKMKLEGSLNYKNSQFYRYGVNNLGKIDTLPTDSLRIGFNDIHFQTNFGNLKKPDEGVSWTGLINYRNFSNNRNQMENQIGFGGYAAKTITSDWVGFATIKYDLLTYTTNSIQQNRGIFSLEPGIQKISDGIAAKGTLGIVIENYSANDSAKIHLYPNISVGMKFSDEFTAKLNIKSGLQQNTFQALMQENPFASFVGKPLNTSQKIGIGAEAGYLISGFNNKLSVDYGIFDNFYFYQNNYNFNGFGIIYDKVNLLKTRLETSKKLEGRWDVTAGVEYRNYKTTKAKAAWMSPNLLAQVKGGYQINSKIWVGLQFEMLNGMKYLDSSMAVKTMKPIFDVNILSTYSFSPKFSAFLNLHNIAVSNYMRWYGYPTYGINAMVGFRYIPK